MSQTQHPLMQDKPTYYENWGEWKEAWKDPHIENRFSLLFCGFGAPVSRQEEVAERICFYLDVANGHESHLGFEEQRGHGFACRIRTALGEFESIADMRKCLAEKAFQALCLHFFKNTEEGYLPAYAPSWAHNVVVPEVLEKLIWFFTKKDDESGFRDNLLLRRQNHHNEIACEFAFRLCEFAWLFCELRNSSSKEWIILNKAKPKLIPILHHLNRLDILLDTRKFPVDSECMDVLKKLALGKKIYLPTGSIEWGDKYRFPKSVEEAVTGGSRAGQVFLLLKTIHKEEKRLQMLQEAENKRREAERCIRELEK